MVTSTRQHSASILVEGVGWRGDEGDEKEERDEKDGEVIFLMTND
ncbi:hypothetical protein [Trichormus azollae]